MRKKILIAATAVAVIAGSAVAYTAYAQHRGYGYGPWSHSVEDMSAFAEARIAALKAGLALNAEQEALWPPVEATMRELAQKRIEHRAQRHAERGDRSEQRDPIERLRRGAELLSGAGADLARLADVAEPLYQSLDEAQKRRLEVLTQRGMHGMRHEGRGWRRHGYMGDEGRHMGPHMGPRGQGWERGMGPRHRTDWDEERGPRTPVPAERL